MGCATNCASTGSDFNLLNKPTNESVIHSVYYTRLVPAHWLWSYPGLAIPERSLVLNQIYHAAHHSWSLLQLLHTYSYPLVNMVNGKKWKGHLFSNFRWLGARVLQEVPHFETCFPLSLQVWRTSRSSAIAVLQGEAGQQQSYYFITNTCVLTHSAIVAFPRFRFYYKEFEFSFGSESQSQWVFDSVVLALANLRNLVPRSIRGKLIRSPFLG